MNATIEAPTGLVSRELQQLWFTLQRERWTSLLILPAPGVGSALAMANGLVQIARRSSPESACALVDATRATLEDLPALRQQIARRAGARERTLVLSDTLERNPAGLGLASACEAAVLCVALGASDVDSARETLARVGSLRVLGSVVLGSA